MLKYIVLSSFVFLYYLISFFLYGTLFSKRFKEAYSLPFSLIIGCFIYFSCFNLVALPMKLCFRPLSELTGLWVALVIVVSMVLVFCYRKYLGKVIKGLLDSIKQNPLLWAGILLLFFVQYTYIGSQSGYWIGVTDDLYYISDVNTSVYTNTIQQYHYLYGVKRDELSYEYLLQMYPVHSAVICQLTGLPPLVENKRVLSAVWVLLVDCVYYIWGQLLFKKNNKKCLLLLGIVTWIMFCQRKVTSSFAGFMIYRTAEGKNILANLVIPFLIYLFARLMIYNGRKQDWQLLFITVVGSFCIVMSSMFILPFLLGSFYVCCILLKKQWQMLRAAVICALPCVLVVTVYVLSKMGVIVFKVP